MMRVKEDGVLMPICEIQPITAFFFHPRCNKAAVMETSNAYRHTFLKRRDVGVMSQPHVAAVVV